ncbi:BTB/POZ domain-containing protein [Morus notabilis]|uniref:BTB/POZ domain-containing protein n=1 Tax=Morus notabilis TaxID=981085 RepID=W9S8A2_9ROSA|nr:BTB/POZ domain-containing protein At3g49900 [Morus notabilis]EXB94050.1 BTB/POZ domain-containing protein [Morus notabilis]
MKAWKNLGAVETIYEEECEFSSSSSSLSPSPSSPPTPLHSRVDKWSLAAGKKTEVLIRVRGKCFHLHKDPLASRSTYLKQQLTDSVSEFTLSPPLNITAEAFTLVADFCYGARLVITPFNLAALRTAAELLEMTEANGDDDDDEEDGSSLVHITDTYFRRVVAVNREYTSIVFRSSLALLPEAETAAFLVSRCIEALDLTDDGLGDCGMDWFEDVILTVCPEDFHVVAEAMQRRFNSHDVVYKIVELYIRGHNGKITEEQKSQICSSIDCNKLSHKLLLDAVQNPLMPLRFVVRAMLLDQLNTRRSILSATADRRRRLHSDDAPPMTLGALIHRDAAIRQASHLKATLDATTLRLRSLEEELSGMKKLLLQNADCDHDRSLVMDRSGGRSASFHVGSENKVRKEDRFSANSARFHRCGGEEESRVKSRENSLSLSSCKANAPTLRKRIGQGLINGLRKAFGVRPAFRGKENNNDDLTVTKVSPN